METSRVIQENFLFAILPEVVREANKLGERSDRLDCESCGDWLRKIAGELGAHVRESVAVPGDGYVAKNCDGSYCIHLSSREELRIGRRNFTLAHEIAHVMLDGVCPHIEQYASRASSTNEIIETSVNRIAAGLLMPESLVIRLLVKHQWECEGEGENLMARPNANAFWRTCRELGVSREAMLRRIVELPKLAAFRFSITFPPDRVVDSKTPFPCRIRKVGEAHCHIVGRWDQIYEDLWAHINGQKDESVIQALVNGELVSINCYVWQREMCTRNNVRFNELVAFGWKVI